MIAEIYSLKICLSPLDMAHNVYQEIIEIYLPSKKIAFNEDNSSFHCFLADKSRYKENAKKMGEVEIPKAMVQALMSYVNASKRMKKTKQWFKRCIKAKYLKK